MSDKVTKLLDQIKRQEMICRGCETYKRIGKEQGQKAQKDHCLNICKVGIEIQRLGADLLAEQKERRLDRDAKRWRDHRAKDQRHRKTIS